MILLILLAALTVPGAIAALTFPARLARTAVIVSTLVMAAGVLALGVGVVGRITGQRASMAAMGSVDPQDRPTILHAGAQESAVSLTFGAAVGLPALLFGALCLAVQLRRLPNPSPR